MPTLDDLKYFQSMPLDIKVAMTKTRIREWVNAFGESGVYISFSGGKDSTVLLHLVRELYPDVPAVFVNTGLEYPEIQSFAKSFPNVTVLKPRMPFNKVISEYGYPIIGKNVAHILWHYRLNNAEGKYTKYFDGSYKKSNGEESRFNYSKYETIAHLDFIVSDICCDRMKKDPIKKYNKTAERVPMIATLAEESFMRQKSWLQTGCNSFEGKAPQSKPMSFWTENDVLHYIDDNNIPMASVYGDIIKNNGQLSMIDDPDSCKYRTSGCDRTGCIFCGFGAHMEAPGESRFKRLKETHPKQYNYCIGGVIMTLTGCGNLINAA